MSKLSNLLRYNGRHHFYWRIAGDHGRTWPQLNPISSCYGPRVKNISAYEPRWLFKIRQRVFCFAGRQRCGRRDDPFSVNWNDGAMPDTWDTGPDGNRTCSYCGSIHFDDMMKICRLVLADERYAIEGTTKSYKVYVTQPGVRNAGEGAIKFYKQHSPEAVSDEDEKLFVEAVRISNERFSSRWAAFRAGRKVAA